MSEGKMAEEQTVIAAEAEPAAELPPISINMATDGKAEIRTKVWDYLATHKLANFPWPPHKRIPNFKGAEDAGDRVLKMDAFIGAKVLKVDPDKPLQQVRIHALDESKSLLVPTPRLRYGFLNKITPPPDSDKRMIRTCATRQGFAEYSAPVGLEDKVNVDLVIVGSVAVSTKGWRVGKGEGFSDLEYAIMASMGAVSPKTPVVAVVHDCQVIDLPEGIFGRHDVAVDYIVTPTRIITCEGRPARPAGVIWELLNAERLEAIPILRKLRYRDWKAGADVKIAGETEAPTELVDEEVKMEDTEERRSKPRSFRRNVNRRRPRRNDDGGADENAAGDGGDSRRNKDDGGEDDGGEKGVNGRRRTYSGGRGRGRGRRGGGRGGGGGRTRVSETDRSSGDHEQGGDDKENRGGVGGRGGRGRGGRRGGFRSGGGGGRRPFDDFEGSVYVGSIPRSLRVSDFKGEVRDRKVNPLRVMWRGSSGFAFLNFKTKQEAEDALVMLEGLHFDGDRDLRLELARDREPRGSTGGGSSSGGGGGSRRRRQRDSRSEDEGGEDGGRDGVATQGN